MKKLQEGNVQSHTFALNRSITKLMENEGRNLYMNYIFADE